MRARNAGLAALLAAGGIWLGFAADPSMAATRQAAKKEVRASTAANDRPIVLSKFKKQRQSTAAKKARTAQAKHPKEISSKAVSEKASARRASARKNIARESAASNTQTEQTMARNAAAGPGKPELPPEVANAHAQALAEDQARNIAALDSTSVSDVNGVLLAAAEPPPAGSEPPAADDASASQDAAPPPVTAAPPPPLPNGKIIRAVPSGDRQVVKADDGDTWNKTSLIGKIFIAFGGLLTLASAARLMIT